MHGSDLSMDLQALRAALRCGSANVQQNDWFKFPFCVCRLRIHWGPEMFVPIKSNGLMRASSIASCTRLSLWVICFPSLTAVDQVRISICVF